MDYFSDAFLMFFNLLEAVQLLVPIRVHFASSDIVLNIFCVPQKKGKMHAGLKQANNDNFHLK